MSVNLKSYVYTKGVDEALDAQFAAATPYARTKLGHTHIFWKAGFRWYCIPVTRAQRIFRRLEPVYGKLCCGGKSFIIERLVLILHTGEELVIHIGDDVKKDAEALFERLKASHPQLQYGKG